MPDVDPWFPLSLKARSAVRDEGNRWRLKFLRKRRRLGFQKLEELREMANGLQPTYGSLLSHLGHTSPVAHLVADCSACLTILVLIAFHLKKKLQCTPPTNSPLILFLPCLFLQIEGGKLFPFITRTDSDI